jgi:biotin---protein ligase
MNVLVYNGPGVSQTSLSHTISSLKALLSPHFSVQTVSATALASQPWSESCALLVLPGGRDLPYLTSLATATTHIRSYVNNGGAFLGICAGAYYASRRVEWESGTKLEVSGSRPLAFFEGICKGCVYPGFAYDSENGARAVAVEDVDEAEIMYGMYFNGGGEFIGVDTSKTATVLAKYVEEEGQGKVAAVRCRVGKGSAVLWGTHPEYPSTHQPLLSALNKRSPPLTEQEVRTNETRRWKLMRKTLSLLGLQLPADVSDFPRSAASPLPQILTSPIPALVMRVYNLLAMHATSTGSKVLQDANDSFQLHISSSAAPILQEARSRSDRPVELDELEFPKDIIFYGNGELPPAELTPKFSIRQYYSHLSTARNSHVIKALNGTESWGMGQLLLYGEAVTSTQTLLDRYSTTFPIELVS